MNKGERTFPPDENKKGIQTVNKIYEIIIPKSFVYFGLLFRSHKTPRGY